MHTCFSRMRPSLTTSHCAWSLYRCVRKRCSKQGRNAVLNKAILLCAATGSTCAAVRRRTTSLSAAHSSALSQKYQTNKRLNTSNKQTVIHIKQTNRRTAQTSATLINCETKGLEPSVLPASRLRSFIKIVASSTRATHAAVASAAAAAPLTPLPPTAAAALQHVL